jgi:hypothetical protein
MSEETKSTSVKKQAVKRTTERKTKAGETILEATHDTSDDPIANINQEKVMIKMVLGEAYYSPTVEFTKEEPFQLVDPHEANYLLTEYSSKFVSATKKMVEDFYQLG